MPKFKLKNKSIDQKQLEEKNVTQIIEINSTNCLIKETSWDLLTLTSVKTKETWNGWKSIFAKAETCSNVIKGHNDNNDAFTIAQIGDQLLICSGKKVFVTSKLTMAVVQRNIPGTSTFDIVWCFCKEQKIFESVFHKEQYDKVLSFVSTLTSNIFENADPFNWKTFLKVQKEQNGEEEDWIAVFLPFTDSETSDSDYVTSESEEDDSEWEDRPTKRAKH